MLIYLGPKPPPYGGVTVKNTFIFENLIKQDIKIKTSSFYAKKNLRIIRLLIEIFSKTPFVIGISIKSLNILTSFLYFLNKNKMKKSIVFVMGGTIQNEINKKNIIKFKQYKKIYVELEEMKKPLNDIGLRNVAVFPNCKPAYLGFSEKVQMQEKRKLVYFSQISKEKGFDSIIELDRHLANSKFDLSIDVYGEIYSDYKNHFKSNVDKLKNINYKGIYQIKDSESLYHLLSQYDGVLFPTLWSTEGVPGIIVESKIVGIPVIASDKSFNEKLILNNKNGIILKNVTGKDLFSSIKKMYQTDNFLREMKVNSRKDSSNYIIDLYLPSLIQTINS